MPLKPRKVRVRAGADGVSDAIKSFFWWGGTLGGGSGHDWAAGKSFDEIMAVFKEHKKEILSWYIEKNRSRNGDPGKRPYFFWYEIEEKYPRRKTGTHKWIGSCRADGGDRTIVDDVYETDLQYLKRLKLPLEPWEIMKK